MKLRSILPMRWGRLIKEADLVPGKIQVRKIPGRLIGAVSIDGNIYVFDGRCPHAGRSLAGSDVSSDGIVVCPGHGLRYALISQPCSVNPMPLNQLPFRVRDGVIEVDRYALRRRRATVVIGDDRANTAAGRRG